MIRAIHRRADPLENQVAWNLKQKITDEKQPRPQAVAGFGKMRVPHHLQLGHRHVRAIQKVDHVQNAQERNQSPHDLFLGISHYQ